MTDAFRFFLECINLFFIIYLIGYSMLFVLFGCSRLQLSCTDHTALNRCTINCGKAITYRFPFLFRLITKRLR